MPIMAIYRSSDVDQETFNRYRAEVPIEPTPKGAIFHQVAFDDDGLLVIDIWENAADLAAFGEAKIVPALQKLGIAPIVPQVLPVYALWATEGAQRHNLAAPAPKSVPA
jgi:hypothetical protein